MKKTVVSIALTGALALGTFTVPFKSEHILFNSSLLVAEAAASDFTDGNKITDVDKVRDGESGNMDSVIAYFYSISKPGTLIFKIKKSSNGSWDSTKKLNLSYLTKKEKICL